VDTHAHLPHDCSKGAITPDAASERRHRQHYYYPNEAAINFIDGLRDVAHLVTDLPQMIVVTRDPNDDMVIATAQRAQAAYIVTRDKDLLSLHHYEGIAMITPEAFIAIVRKQETRRTERNRET
jgi:predicted nucleic acid-binding protein